MSKFIYNGDYHELWCRKTTSLLSRQTVDIPYHPFVQSVFVVRNLNRIASPTIILPDVSPHLIIYLYHAKPSRFRMIGPRSKAVYLTHANRSRTIIFRFRPAALGTLIKSSLLEWVDTSSEMSEAFSGLLHKEILLSMIEGADYQGVVQYVLEAIRPHHDVVPTKGFTHSLLESTSSCQKVAEIADEIGVSSRYLRKKIKEETGFSPKLLLKIGRLTRALATGTSCETLPFSHLAVEAGYYDQSHMIDEFQQFLRQTPRQLLS